MKRQRGFTIIELMITVGIAMIILAFGVPSFQQFMRDNQTATQVNNLVTALNLARGEAVTRGMVVAVAPLVAGDWTQGWAVGIDDDRNGLIADTGTEPVFRVFDGIEYGTLPAPAGRVEFSATGEAVNPRTFVFTPQHCTGDDVRQIDIGASGHVELTLVACP